MKLLINSVEIKKYKELHYVRINIGGYMYFDSPMTTKHLAQGIFYNLDNRIDNRSNNNGEIIE